jgi:hypothetical protein
MLVRSVCYDALFTCCVMLGVVYICSATAYAHELVGHVDEDFVCLVGQQLGVVSRAGPPGCSRAIQPNHSP